MWLSEVASILRVSTRWFLRCLWWVLQVWGGERRRTKSVKSFHSEIMKPKKYLNSINTWVMVLTSTALYVLQVNEKICWLKQNYLNFLITDAVPVYFFQQTLAGSSFSKMTICRLFLVLYDNIKMWISWTFWIVGWKTCCLKIAPLVKETDLTDLIYHDDKMKNENSP